ncbi:WD repeat-containing protein 11 [Cichlidogyrus casuarinus]|uniref:WD repeat-containing protein 11 n=1 Tax=Cichlidogyrus casuarinus TaxID=1844966 RepID=A0ABD2QCC3_9PLAT
MELLECRRMTAQQTKQCVSLLVQLGQYDRAVKILLETRPDQPEYVEMMQKACLVAAATLNPRYTQDQSSYSSRNLFLSTLEGSAMELISNGHFDEGIEMLCLMGNQMEACKQLMEKDKTITAVWLAKSTLKKEDCETILRKWAVALISSKSEFKVMAAFVFIYLGDHVQAMQILNSLHHYQIVARYAESIEQLGLFEELISLLDRPLYNSIKTDAFVEFARVLSKVGHKSAAMYYAQKAGERGQPLAEEIDYLLN